MRLKQMKEMELLRKTKEPEREQELASQGLGTWRTSAKEGTNALGGSSGTPGVSTGAQGGSTGAPGWTTGALGGNTGALGVSTGGLGGSTCALDGSTGTCALGGSTGALGRSTGALARSTGAPGGCLHWGSLLDNSWVLNHPKQGLPLSPPCPHPETG